MQSVNAFYDIIPENLYSGNIKSLEHIFCSYAFWDTEQIVDYF